MKHPSWLKSLVIYEISTKAFSSPKGPGTGTFESLSLKLPYIKDLGINGIWLSGHSLSNNNHFYNIWTQYACIDPSKLDPSLGSKKSFKKLIEKAHSLGIKIFLDVITHGVMSDSPLVKKFPHWFKSGSWGMTDYDWFGNHQDLDRWWIKLWLNYVKEFGVDGFRLDVAIYRPNSGNIIIGCPN
jgi:glycosidase